MTEPRVRCTLRCESSAEELRFEVRLMSIAYEPVLVSVQSTYPATHAEWLSAAVKTPRGLAAPRPFSFFSHPDRMLLWFGRIPLPPGVEAYAPFLPLYARLNEGESHLVRFMLPLPIEELDPYFDPPSDAQSVSALARRIVVVCDYIPVANTRWIDRGPHGLVFCSGASFVRIHSAVDLDRAVAILSRTDAFYRPVLDQPA